MEIAVLEPLVSFTFSPGGARIVTGLKDHTARICDAATGNEIAVLRGHKNWVNSVAFSPDGSRVATGSSDDTGRIWDIWDAKD
jgi:WD40 repeat protein